MKRVASLLPLLWGFTASAQTNSWDSTLGGNWHDVEMWSAGVLPETNQTILITSAGTKTVRIGPETVANYPESLRVDSLTVSAPSDWRSTLLLDSTGTNQFQAARLDIDENGELAVANSAAVSGELLVKGSAAQWGNSYVYPSRLDIRAGGVYNLIEGILRVGRHHIGSTSRWAGEGEDFHQEILPGVFNQYGGTNRVLEALGVDGTYNLRNGRLQSHQWGYGAMLLQGELNQSGGVVDMPILLGRRGTGRYNLGGGLRTGGPIHVWGYERLAAGHIVQTGGTNVGAIQLTPYIPSWGNGGGLDSSYTLADGEIRSTTVTIGAFGRFVQYGGLHYNETLILSNSVVCKKHQPGRLPDCNTVYARYGLDGGVLVSSNIWSQGSFSQSGGRLVVENLQISGTGFSLSGGELLATQITIGSRFTDRGGMISDRARIQMNGGSWVARAGTRRLGPLALGGTTIPTRFLFPAESASILEFAASASWSAGSTLVITNWSGSFSGGGLHQLRFGSDATGLTPAQSERIQFENPNGIGGVHPARILADGEVVPAPTRMVAEKRHAQLFLHLPPGFVVQTSTNIHGPFEDMPAALSTSPMQFTDPARFFRIRPEQ